MQCARARVSPRIEKLFDESEIRFTVDPAGKMYHRRSKVGDFLYPFPSFHHEENNKMTQLL